MFILKLGVGLFVIGFVVEILAVLGVHLYIYCQTIIDNYDSKAGTKKTEVYHHYTPQYTWSTCKPNKNKIRSK